MLKRRKEEEKGRQIYTRQKIIRRKRRKIKPKR